MSNVSLDAASLQTIINNAVAAALKGQAARAAKGGKSRSAKPVVSTMGKTDRQIAIEKAVITAFKRAGFGTVVPRVDVRTFGRWLEAGFVPKKGEKATKVKQFRLFHKSQVEPATARPEAEDEPTREEVTASSLDEAMDEPSQAEIEAFIAEQRGKARLIPAEIPRQQSRTAEILAGPTSAKPTLHVATNSGDDIPY